MKNILFLCMCTIIIALSLQGCASSYYKISDPATGKVYFSQDIERKGSGAVQFKDDISKTQVTLQQSEIMEITKDQYEAGTGK